MKYLSIIILLHVATLSNGQSTFWSEDFGTGCNQGQLANGYSTSNGNWTVTTNTSDNAANVWYISGREDGLEAGNCGTACIANDHSLHVGSIEIIYMNITVATEDYGAAYNVGGINSFGFDSQTDIRAESPIIDCTNKSNVSVSFNYLEGGQGIMDNAELVADFGSGWVLLENLPKTVTSCSPQGLWTSYSRSIPAADGQPNVKIGFRWVNNDDGAGSDPSFAVDDILLSESIPTGISTEQARNGAIVDISNGVIEVSLLDATEQIRYIRGYNLIGQELVNSLRNDATNRIEVDNYSGILVLEIETNFRMMTRKIVISK